MGEGATKGCERLARALGAAREMMCCYGRLEAELRIVEDLETSREKMLLKMRRLYKDLADSRPQGEPLFIAQSVATPMPAAAAAAAATVTSRRPQPSKTAATSPAKGRQ
ncbi:unnamed protein product, partial [Scytosiphon promiscuus]